MATESAGTPDIESALMETPASIQPSQEAGNTDAGASIHMYG